jgi:hypothetical protein
VVGSALRGFGAEGADRPGISLVERAPVLNGKGSNGRPRRPPMAATAPWVASAPKVRHVWWPWPRQTSTPHVSASDVKRAPYEEEIKGVACKGGSTVRIHAS